jgi:RNA polymerase sigma-70 factor, ECF subfamily
MDPATSRAEWQQKSRYSRLAKPLLNQLFRFSCRLEGDTVRGEDLLQQSVLKGLTRIDQLADDGAFKVWQCQIIYRTFLNNCKRRTPTSMPNQELENVVPFDSHQSDPARQASTRELGRQIGSALRLLPEPQREVVWLIDGEGFKYSEVSEILGIPPGTAASRLLRGRTALREHLKSVAQERGVIQ